MPVRLSNGYFHLKRSGHFSPLRKNRPPPCVAGDAIVHVPGIMHLGFCYQLGAIERTNNRIGFGIDYKKQGRSTTR